MHSPRERYLCRFTITGKSRYMVENSYEAQVANWEFFQVEFQKKYIDELHLEYRKQEFLMLK
ncbi:hypothetical protein EPI10_020576 [Gossypium australe]|uniref:Uncharacterized protein n=1 Tax=Gossypium australe TaxID=47621 RepID=A0A5B6WG80_9ROSI|nr:hypothetical protein EPI10_020576 [Gossypium australe]